MYVHLYVYVNVYDQLFYEYCITCFIIFICSSKQLYEVIIIIIIPI